MIDFVIRTEGQLQIREKLVQLASPDLTPLLRKIEEVLKADIDAARLGGESRIGHFDEIRPATQERRRRAGRGQGEPLVPDDRSRFASVATDIDASAPGVGVVVAGWPAADGIIRYHRDGTPFMPARDPLYVPDRTWQKIRELIRDFYGDILIGGGL